MSNLTSHTNLFRFLPFSCPAMNLYSWINCASLFWTSMVAQGVVAKKICDTARKPPYGEGVTRGGEILSKRRVVQSAYSCEC